MKVSLVLAVLIATHMFKKGVLFVRYVVCSSPTYGYQIIVKKQSDLRFNGTIKTIGQDHYKLIPLS